MSHPTPEQIKAGQIIGLFTDLHRISPWRGLLRFLLGLAPVAALTYATFSATSTTAFVALGIATGFAYASLLILTHDALHHTLTGWTWFDELVPRLISAPALWPHGLYSELHKIHHKMNGVDLRDPERVQWTQGEYDQASPWGKWCARHQWFLSLFVWGGLGMIAVSRQSRLDAYGRNTPRLKTALVTDTLGTIAVNGAIYAFAYSQGSALRYFALFWMLERTVGFVHQLRAHVEHYGLWTRAENGVATQVFNSRNLSASPLVSVYFNRLNYHSAHHAFPRIPFYLLPETTRRLEALYGTERPLPRSLSYFSYGLALGHASRLHLAAPRPKKPLIRNTPNS